MAKETVKEEVKMGQVGRNLNVIIGGEKFTIQGSKEELAPAKEAVNAYVAKPTKDNKKKMLDLLKPRTTEVEGMKERIKADKKGAEKAIKEPVEKGKSKKAAVSDVVKNIEEKEYSQEELEKMEAAIQKAKDKKASAPMARTAPQERRRHGEY